MIDDHGRLITMLVLIETELSSRIVSLR